MRDSPESASMGLRCVYDIGRLALLGLVAVPIYLLLNQYWQSIFRLGALYALLGFFCLRLAEYIRRVMRRLPAEIPPWHGPTATAAVAPWQEQRFGAAEAIRSVRWDPQYVEAVLKPRLQRLLVYRLSGRLDDPLGGLDTMQLARLEPAVFDFLQRQEPTGLWAKWRYRRQRLHDVLDTLRRIEAL
jgi:hypothetical protein